VTDGRLGQKLFAFHGRVRRSDWWLLGLLITAVQLAVTGIINLWAFGLNEPFLGTLHITEAGVVISASWWVAQGIGALALWPLLALAVKRGHDIGWPAFVVVGLYLVSFGMELRPTDLQPLFAPFESLLAPFLAGFALFLNLVIFVALGVVDGTPGANRYGASPKLDSLTASE
jgi:uncharacterized membrane protein YhaH (DUF805 family)